MAVSTTQSIWRSGGGDQTRTAYCGNGTMIAQFYIPDITAASTAKALNVPNGVPVILPANAVVTSIAITATTSSGGTSPTIDVGFTGYSSGTTNVQALGNEVPSNARGNVTLSSATAGTSLGLVASATELVYLTAGAGASPAASGAITGYVTYFVVDPYAGQQNV